MAKENSLMLLFSGGKEKPLRMGRHKKDVCLNGGGKKLKLGGRDFLSLRQFPNCPFLLIFS